MPTLSSDPPLPAADILALLFSDVRRTEDVELRALQNPTQRQTDLLSASAAETIAKPISEAGKMVQRTFGVDTFQLTPFLTDVNSTQASRLNPTARLTIGKRISDRVYLTFSRSLASSINDQIILLEYDASERVSWMLSRNEDSQSYALEFRVRHTLLMPDGRSHGARAIRTLDVSVRSRWCFLCCVPASCAVSARSARRGRRLPRQAGRVRPAGHRGPRDQRAAHRPRRGDRVGEPLAMAAVRDTISHLFSLGRFDDIRVDATLVDAGRVALRYELSPIHPVTKIQFAGRLDVPGVDAGSCARRWSTATVRRRRSAASRSSSSWWRRAARKWLSSRRDQAAGRASRTRRNGRRSCSPSIRVRGRRSAPSTSIGTPTRATAELLARLDLAPGAPYRRDALNARIERYIADRRKARYYEAKLAVTAALRRRRSDRANLTLTVSPGRTSAWCSKAIRCRPTSAHELVPVEREGSVDEDLLEDSTNADRGLPARTRAIATRRRRIRGPSPAASWS